MMSDLHDDRIAEMIDDLDDGHINVELDFISVVDGLPVDISQDHRLVCLCDSGKWIVDCFRWQSLDNYPNLADDPRCCGIEESTFGPGGFCLPDGTTHWAEIPEVNDVS